MDDLVLSSPIKRGTARRLGLRRPPQPLVLATITGTPHGTLRAVAGVNGRSWVQNTKGTAVHVGVAIGSGMVRDTRPTSSLFGVAVERTSYGKPSSARDMIAASMPDHVGTVMARDQIVEKWCADHGKDKDALEMADIIAIRSLPEWQKAG